MVEVVDLNNFRREERISIRLSKGLKEPGSFEDLANRSKEYFFALMVTTNDDNREYYFSDTRHHEEMVSAVIKKIGNPKTLLLGQMYVQNDKKVSCLVLHKDPADNDIDRAKNIEGFFTNINRRFFKSSYTNKLG